MAVSRPTPTAVRARSSLLYVPFGLLNATIAGVLGIALPLFAREPGRASLAGALLNLGLAVGAPVAGWLSARLSRVRVLAGSLLGAGLAVLAVALPQPVIFLTATLAVGLCASVGLTLATLFVMGWYPKARWDAQIGWLQTWMGAGQVLGLLAASVVTGRRELAALGAGLLFVAAAWSSRLPPPAAMGEELRPGHVPRQSPRTEVVGVLTLHHLAAFSPRAWPVLRQRAVLVFLVPWSLAQLGTAPLFALYPLLLRARFDLPTSVAAGLFALAALIGALLYEPAGALTVRYGAPRVLVAGYAARVLALALVAGAILLRAAPVMASGFVLVVITWSFLAVAGNARVADLAPPGSAGAEFGAVAAAATLAKVVGNLLAGTLVAGLGYGALVGAGAALLGLATLWTAIAARDPNTRGASP
jgi:DHA1 family tetracycline resistance protein-like MFS transporter